MFNNFNTQLKEIIQRESFSFFIIEDNSFQNLNSEENYENNSSQNGFNKNVTRKIKKIKNLVFKSWRK